MCGPDRYALVLWLIWPLASAFATHQQANALRALLIRPINNLRAHTLKATLQRTRNATCELREQKHTAH